MLRKALGYFLLAISMAVSFVSVAFFFVGIITSEAASKMDDWAYRLVHKQND